MSLRHVAVVTVVKVVKVECTARYDLHPLHSPSSSKSYVVTATHRSDAACRLSRLNACNHACTDSKNTPVLAMHTVLAPPEPEVAMYATQYIAVRAWSVGLVLVGFVAIGTFRGFKVCSYRAFVLHAMSYRGKLWHCRVEGVQRVYAG
jgi:hypothetical protein